MRFSFTPCMIPPNGAHFKETCFKQLVFRKLKLQPEGTSTLVTDIKETDFITMSFKQLYFSFLKLTMHETDCLKQVSSVCGTCMCYRCRMVYTEC